MDPFRDLHTITEVEERMNELAAAGQWNLYHERADRRKLELFHAEGT